MAVSLRNSEGKEIGVLSTHDGHRGDYDVVIIDEEDVLIRKRNGAWVITSTDMARISIGSKHDYDI